jgi:hypothetical protein
MDFLTLEDGTDTCPETTVKDYHSTLQRNTPEERRSRSSGDSFNFSVQNFYVSIFCVYI